MPSWKILASLFSPLRRVQSYSRLRLAVEKRQPYLQMIQQLVQPGQSVVDFAAGYGLYTKFLAESVGSTGMVHAVEPITERWELLQTNVTAWKRTNIQIYRQLCEVQTDIDFFRCEIPGEELNYLRQCKSWIQEYRPVLFVHLQDNPNKPFSMAYQVFQMLRSLEYEAYWFQDNRWKRQEAGERSSYYFFLQPAHVQQVPKAWFGEEERRRAA